MKTDPSSKPTAPPSARGPAARSRAARNGLCVLGAAASIACPAVPTGQELPECTRAHIESMDEITLVKGDGIWGLRVDANQRPPGSAPEADWYHAPTTLRVGPIISEFARRVGRYPKGTRFYGYMLGCPGKPDGFTECKIRYYEMQVPGEKARLICGEAEQVRKVGGTDERPVVEDNIGAIKLVLQFSE